MSIQATYIVKREINLGGTVLVEGTVVTASPHFLGGMMIRRHNHNIFRVDSHTLRKYFEEYPNKE